MRWMWLLVVAAGCGGDDGVHHLADAPPAPYPEAARGVYVTNAANSILVFPLDQDGDVAPARTISGAATGLNLSLGFAIEPGTGDLFIANRQGGTVTVYQDDASGNVAPKKTLTATGMDSPASVEFESNGELFVGTCPNCGASKGGQIGVWHFEPGATTSDSQLGAASNTNTGFTNPGMTIDPASGNLVISNSFGGNVTTFPREARGDVAPLRTFSPGGINLQAVTVGIDTLFITSGNGDPIRMWPLDATGSSAGASIANGGMLSVSYPAGLAIDTATGTPVMYLADFSGNKVHIITLAGSAPSWTVSGVKTIAGPTTGLDQPIGIRVIR